MKLTINEGGKLNNLTEKLKAINIYSDGNECINFRIIDTDENESLTYLSLKEAIELKIILQRAINNAT